MTGTGDRGSANTLHGQGMRILVTGSRGQLGRALERAGAARGHEVVGVDLPELDVTDRGAVLDLAARVGPAAIVNCAAFTAVDAAEAREAAALAVNATAVGHLAQAANAVGATLVQVSTDYVFDGNGSRPYLEGDPPAPLGAYGRTKLAGELQVAHANPEHAIVRTAWLFGAGGPNFVDAILARARAGQRLRVVDDQRGSPTFTRDLAEGLLRLMAAGQYGTYHCSNSGDCTWYDLAAYAVERAGLPLAPERTDTASFPRPAKRPAYSVLGNARFEQVTGWRMPPWRDAVDRHLADTAGVPRRTS